MRELVVNEDRVDAGWERWETKRLRMREPFLAGKNFAACGIGIRIKVVFVSKQNRKKSKVSSTAMS